MEDEFVYLITYRTPGDNRRYVLECETPDALIESIKNMDDSAQFVEIFRAQFVAP